MAQKKGENVIFDVWKTISGLHDSVNEHPIANSYLKTLDPTADISLYSQLHLITYLREIVLEKTKELVEHIEESYKEILESK
ncbi:MAG: hypothetical protein ACW981_06565 [Candidatus Hodarchaeales archaeon]|jgi:hypothetical protein